MNSIHINDQEIEHLRLANESKKYGHLVSWKELYLFQRAIATKVQIKEIAAFAKRKIRGEKIKLPLMLHMSTNTNMNL